jgi:hypothetical protein
MAMQEKEISGTSSIQTNHFAIQNPLILEAQDKKQKELLRQLQKEYKHDFLEFLTFNIAGLPPNIMPGLECTGANMQSAQELRVRGFIQYLHALSNGVHPYDNCHLVGQPSRVHLIALQEVIWKPLQHQMHKMLLENHYTTHDKISLLTRKDEPPMMYDGGLALYVDSHKLEILDAELYAFEDRTGLDIFCEKGFIWALLRCKSTQKKFMVVNVHPQAYTDLTSILDSVNNNPDSKELLMKGQEQNEMLKMLLMNGVQTRDELVALIRETQRKQFEQIRQVVDSKLTSFFAAGSGGGKLKGLFYMGDFNVNRWNVEPFSKEENNSFTALGKGKMSQDIVHVMNTLKCRQPPIVRSPVCHSDTDANRVLFQDLFTWNSAINVQAGERKAQIFQYQWLDYIMYSTHPRIPMPLYADNHREFIAVQPFPDLSSLSSSACYASSSSSSSSSSQHEQDAKANLQRGVYQLETLLARFNALLQKRGYPPFTKPELAVDPATRISVKLDILRAWVLFVRTANYFDSSQLWKGFAFYGFKKSDSLTDQQRAMLKGLYIGAPHPFRMLRHASDHFGVSARLVLPP